jgi:putative membrane protein
MRQAALIFFLVLAIGVALFAVQNAGPVALRFGFWSVEMSLVVVVLVAAALGAILASLLSLPGWVRDRRLLRQQSKELEGLRASRPSATPGPSPDPKTRPSA